MCDDILTKCILIKNLKINKKIWKLFVFVCFSLSLSWFHGQMQNTYFKSDTKLIILMIFQLLIKFHEHLRYTIEQIS